MADQRMALSTAVDSLWVRWHNSPSSKAPVAQLDRAFGYEPKGRTFESCRAYFKINSLRQVKHLPFFICDNFVKIFLRIARSHSRDGVALAGIARVPPYRETQNYVAEGLRILESLANSPAFSSVAARDSSPSRDVARKSAFIAGLDYDEKFLAPEISRSKSMIRRSVNFTLRVE